MAIDIHSHILPGIDDGAKNMQETIKMIDIAVEQGIKAAIATPHYHVGVGPEYLTNYQKAYQEVAQYIEENKIPLQLYRGNEIYYSESIPERLRAGKLRTMCGSRYVLVEFSPDMEYSAMERAISKLLYEGCWPIIAHAERYVALRQVSRVEELIRIGAYIQLNTNAIAGKEGWATKRHCHKLLKAGLVHVIGTDAHSSRTRRPQMKECLAILDKKYGKAYRKRLSDENPGQIIKGEKISKEDYV